MDFSFLFSFFDRFCDSGHDIQTPLGMGKGTIKQNLVLGRCSKKEVD